MVHQQAQQALEKISLVSTTKKTYMQFINKAHRVPHKQATTKGSFYAFSFFKNGNIHLLNAANKNHSDPIDEKMKTEK